MDPSFSSFSIDLPGLIFPEQRMDGWLPDRHTLLSFLLPFLKHFLQYGRHFCQIIAPTG